MNLIDLPQLGYYHLQDINFTTYKPHKLVGISSSRQSKAIEGPSCGANRPGEICFDYTASLSLARSLAPLTR
jgi:hypothetical protein